MGNSREVCAHSSLTQNIVLHDLLIKELYYENTRQRHGQPRFFRHRRDI